MTPRHDDRLPTHINMRGRRVLIASLTFDQLCVVLSDSFNQPSPLLVAAARVLRRKAQAGNRAISANVLRVMNTVDPPSCACGDKGIYIVGTETMCRRCVQRTNRGDMQRRMRADSDARISERERRERQFRRENRG